MFYSKYRPQRFSDMVGLGSTTKALLKEISSGKVGHAYFFFGPRGTGKTSMARLVAKALNCLAPSEDGEPCTMCANCVAIAQDRFLDLIEIDAASNRGIDDIRGLRDRVKLAPSSGKYKVYIIDEVHMLTTEAFNALLKTLEEPPKSVVFVLCTTDPQKVLSTIRSRCQQFEFKRGTTEDLVIKLKRILKSEGGAVDEDDLRGIAQASLGGFRDAETMLEQVLLGGISVSDLLYFSSEESFPLMVDYLSVHDAVSAITLINNLFEEGTNLERWLEGYLGYLRKLLLVQVGLGESFVEATPDQFKKMQVQAATLGDSLPRVIRFFLRAFSESHQAVVPQLPLEMAVAEFCPVNSLKGSQVTNPALSEGSTTGTAGTDNDQDLANGSSQMLEEVNKNWDAVLKAIRPYNHSLEAILRSCSPCSCTKELLTLATYYQFHQQQLESSRNRHLLEKILSDLLGRVLKVKCILQSKPESVEGGADSTLAEERGATKDELATSALTAFNGGL